MLKEKDAVVRRTVIVLDAFILAGTFILAYFIRAHFHNFYRINLIPSRSVVPAMSVPFSNYLVVMFIAVPLWCIVLYANGMYRPMRTLKFFGLLRAVFKSTFFTAFAFGSIVFFVKLHFISRVFFVIFLVLASVLLLIEKTLIFFTARYMRRQGYNYRRLVIVGTGRRAVDFIDKIKSHPEWGFKLIGIVNDEQGRSGDEISDAQIIGSIEEMPKILKKFSVDEVVFLVPRSRLPYIENALYAC